MAEQVASGTSESKEGALVAAPGDVDLAKDPMGFDSESFTLKTLNRSGSPGLRWPQVTI